MKLSEHFKLHEFVNSTTALIDGIDNTPSKEVIEHLKALCKNVLEPLRQWYGKPIIIGSGYRCPKLNKAVGGMPNSQHLTGEAADIHISDNAEGMKLFRYIRDHLKYDQLIKERNTKSSTRFWIHVSFSADGCNRMQVIDNLIKHKT